MEIEKYKGYQIQEKDIDQLKPFCDIKSTYIENNSYNVFDNIILEKFDWLSFEKLCFIASRILRNCNDKSAFETGLRLSYWLIEKGEQYVKDNPNYAVSKEIAYFYDILAEIVYYNEQFAIIPYKTQGEKYDIDQNTKLAVRYWETAHLIDPNSTDICFCLGMHYYLNNDYYKAYAYLIQVGRDSGFYGQSDGFWVDLSIYTELGNIFNNTYKENHELFEDRRAFLCFERAYLIAKEDRWKDSSTIVHVLYNMAYAYIYGIGVKKNINKGLTYLKFLEKKLTKRGENIFDIEDPDKIVSDYYKKILNK